MINLNLGHRLRMYQQKYYASGSPLRYLRKVTLELANPGASRARSRLGAQLTATLPEIAQERLAELLATGYAEAGEEIDAQLLAELIQAAKGKLAERQKDATRHPFFSTINDEEDLRAESIYVRFALQPAVQKLACAYFHDTIPYLSSANLLLSTGRDASEWTNSQLWHLDYGDCRTLRFWVYLTDVLNVEDGPFTFLPAEPSKKVPNTFFPRRVTDEEMAAAGLADAARQVFGTTAKAFYVDTSRCYHLGSRLKAGKQRLVYDATFITHKPLYPSPNGIRTNGELPETEKYFLTL